MEPLGFAHAYETGDTLIRLSLSDLASLPEMKRGSEIETVILRTNDEISSYGADTTLWNLEVDGKDELDVICAVIVDGRIAAFAAANDLSEDGCEINVECSPAHRRKGFGRACVIGFARYILTETEADNVIYVCRESNEASLRCALSAGFKQVGKSASYVYCR